MVDLALALGFIINVLALSRVGLDLLDKQCIARSSIAFNFMVHHHHAYSEPGHNNL